MTPDPIYFPSPAAFRRWLQSHHRTASEVWVGYHRKDSGVPSLTWGESVDEALCYGWIDGIRKKIDDTRYTNRFTPRKNNRWSAINIARANALIERGRMRPAGLKAFESRDEQKSGYSIGARAGLPLAPALEKRFRANRTAWAFFEAQPAGYRRNAIWFVMDAKQEATRTRRLDELIAASAAGVRLGALRSQKSASG
jgi:uncharacterized protein YdeI (YjbR/CyaY-like superfamily)